MRVGPLQARFGGTGMLRAAGARAIAALERQNPNGRLLARHPGRWPRRRPAHAQNMIRARNSPVVTATAVATTPGIMNEWLSTYLPIFVVPDRSKLIAAISEP